MPRICFLVSIVVVVFLIPGLMGLARGILDLWDWFSSRSWPDVPGKIIKSELKTVSVPGRKSRHRIAHLPEIVYEYSVYAQVFQSSQIFFEKLAPSEYVEASNLVERYPVGSAVSVYHHPGRPEKAILERGPLGKRIMQLVGAGLLLVIGLAVLLSEMSKAGLTGWWGSLVASLILAAHPACQNSHFPLHLYRQ